MRLLIADDDSLSRLRLSAALAESGHDVVAVEDGEAAWRALQGQDAPKLALLDWMMPNMDGLEVIRRVRSIFRSDPIYIILVTSRNTQQDRVQGLDAGADDYLTKPVDPVELRARVRAGTRIVQLQTSLLARVQELQSGLAARKRVEEALMKEQYYLHCLMDRVPDAIYFKDTSSRFTRINLAQAERLGLADPVEAIGKTDFDFFAPELARRYHADEEQVIVSGRPLLSREEPTTDAAGSLHWVSTTKVPLFDQAGKVTGIVGISHDITAQKQSAEALLRSEVRARLLFATVPHPVWVYDVESLNFLEVNEAAVARYGYSRDEFLGMMITDIWPVEEREKLLSELWDPRSADQISAGWKHCGKDGRIFEVEISSHALDYDGHKAALVVALDVSERKRLELDLRQAQKLEAVGQLAAGIAHEINTPIQFVGDNTRFLRDAFGHIERLLDSYEPVRQAAGKVEPGLLEGVAKAERQADWEYLKTEVPRALEQTLDGVNRVARIVRAMREFSHVNRSAEKSAADLNQALESTLVVARNELKYVADVETDFGDIPLVVCNLGDLNQVFLNLLVNAAHAIADVVRDTGNKGMVRLRTWQEKGQVVVAISDTGAGIPEEIRHKVFEPFFTTKEVGRGTGQGLAIARTVVVERHGGILTFESEVGKGSTFFVRLPIGRASNDVPGSEVANQESKIVVRGSELGVR